MEIIAQSRLDGMVLIPKWSLLWHPLPIKRTFSAHGIPWTSLVVCTLDKICRAPDGILTMSLPGGNPS